MLCTRGIKQHIKKEQLTGQRSFCGRYSQNIAVVVVSTISTSFSLLILLIQLAAIHTNYMFPSVL